MIHKITIRDLNNWANQLPRNSPGRKDIHTSVLEAVDAKIPHIFLDDEDEVDRHLLKGIEAAKILEKENNKRKRTYDNQIPYVSVQEYILGRKTNASQF